MSAFGKGLFGGTASFIKLLSAMTEKMSWQDATALDEKPQSQPQACPIKTAVEFGLSVPRKAGDGSKKIFY